MATVDQSFITFFKGNVYKMIDKNAFDMIYETIINDRRFRKKILCPVVTFTWPRCIKSSPHWDVPDSI